MPFSFIDIEEKKTRVIGFLFLFIILFYFVTAYLLLIVFENTAFYAYQEHAGLRVPPFDHTLIAFVVAFFIGIVHWSISTSNIIEKICLSVGAVPIDEKDAYHQYLKNIVDEVSVAIGGRPLEARVIATVGMNAFALQDFEGRALIGVTEGLLARLSRAQVEAVVGHEAGHIISGDCLGTTVTCAVAEIYEEGACKLGTVLKETRGRGSLLLVLIFIVLSLMRFLSNLIRYFISREREYRADAISVRLTRDPLSLAEALELISKNWRGEGAPGEKMQSIFIVNPQPNELDEAEGVFSDMFSTHPPIKKRIDILLNMAHMDEKTLEENLKNFKKASPVAAPEVKTEDLATPTPGKWFVFQDQKWLGPYGFEELKGLATFSPEQWVRPDGAEAVKHAYEDPQLLGLFDRDKEAAKFSCPRCKTSLDEISYEGAPVYKCSYCGGHFVEYDKVSRVLIREDMEVGEDVKRLAETIMQQKEDFTQGLKRAQLSTIWVFDCPKCGENHKMQRQFFVYSYPVEIDRCISCGGIWFDKTELEVLQYLYEHKEKFFDGKNF